MEIADFISGYEERAPQLLRYSFHSCVGGCDGCINLMDSGNGGLEDIHGDAREFYLETIPFGDDALTMSYADFLALSGIVAVDYTIGLNNEACQGDPVCDMKPV